MRQITTTLFLVFALIIYGKQISYEAAHQIATKFLSEKTDEKAVTRISNKPIGLQEIKYGDFEGINPPCYIFNSMNHCGFVIVSADNRLPQIIGYSIEESLDQNNFPPQLKTLLSIYEKEFKNLADEVPVHSSWTSVSIPSRSENDEVLLETAYWNQKAPYNDLCPVIDGEHCLTGCVPTAMAIIMKYHNWPKVGRGIHHTPCFITSASNEVEFDFNTEFDYSAMTDIYDENSSAESKSSVAKLMLAAGAASCANYGIEETGASSTQMIRGMIYYLRYSPKMTALNLESSYTDLQTSFTQQEMEDSVIFQLKRGLPVLACGYTGGFHMFVIDGYNSEGFFHVNLGWGTGSKGFYKLPELYVSSIITNIEPDKSETPISDAYLRDTDFSNIKYLTGLSYDYPWLNISTSSVKKGIPFDCVSPRIFFPVHFFGEFGLAIVDRNNAVREILWSKEQDCRMMDYTYSANIDVREIKPTIEIQEGDRIQIVTKNDGEEYYSIVPSTRQAVSSAPCQGFKPELSYIDWNINKNGIIKAISYSDGKLNSPENLPDKILKGASMNLQLNFDYDIYNLADYDYRLVVDVNGEARELCLNSNINLYLMEDKSTISFDYYGIEEAIDQHIVLEDGERLSDKITPEQAYRTSNLIIEGNLNETDFSYLDKGFPYLISMNLRDVEIEGANEIPADFFKLSNTLRTIVLPKNVEKIRSYALDYCKVKSISIPSSVRYIGFESFGRNENLKDVWIEKPFYHINDLSNAAFFESMQNCTLHVPASEIESCKNHAIWGQFLNIVPFIPGEIDRIEFIDNNIEIAVGQTRGLLVNVFPDYYDEPITWTSDNPEILTVDDTGLIKAVTPGKCTISAKSSNGLIANCEVTVLDVTVNASGVKLNLEKTELVEGDQVQLEAIVTPEDTTDKTIIWTSSDEGIAIVSANGLVTAIKVGSVTITAITHNTIKANCFITVVAKPSGIDDVSSGDQVTVRCEAGEILIYGEGIAEIYSLTGTRIAATATGRVSGLPRGIYLVRFAGKTYKVAL